MAGEFVLDAKDWKQQDELLLVHTRLMRRRIQMRAMAMTMGKRQNAFKICMAHIWQEFIIDWVQEMNI